ncbi:isoprenyl transferase [Methylotenera sp.]|uniref:isoprenyl transferase n=1 Tax=Methylotenera sp. TaxID=2051956 RepID=UPI00271F05AB|nr:isoprenyl transferase [Methylotenera sp.]MDO9204662.1 isoprenyl transferase [Methylotenera sp.]MDO9394110.1 isoprenyl transferase [Methylotenera sp.]MDP2071519.1 isoprenyl transferase [Methylotenera sp.]MDP3004958.1 isoprenyl transferase [Methylotenera sp.]MDP3307140.1 isoprenyl transferase [Methylotenera sp.]
MAFFTSATQNIPSTAEIPKHIAVIMDGNGRWARKRFLPRIAGHKRGVETVRDLVKYCASLKVEYLTLFAFSSENWRRPAEEVTFLMGLFMQALKREVTKLHQNNIKLIMIGDRSRFDAELVSQIEASEQLTAGNTGLILTIAANYGGRWDILQAVNKMQLATPQLTGFYREDHLSQYLSMNYAPEPDLFIRTGGEKRISNFLLWQLAYTELYFTDTLWPDFNEEAFNLAIQSYQKRERRFGRTSEQLTEAKI